jgi:hypothetical protein
MNNVEKLKKFIKSNNLEFNSGSGGDVNILALCGYACYIQANFEEINSSIPENSTTADLFIEIERVLEYAFTHNYAKWWKSEAAKKQWKF